MTRNSTATPESVQPQTSPYFGRSASDRGTPTVAAAIPRATQSSSQVSGIDGALLEAESKIEQASVPEVVHDFLPFQELFKTTITLEFGENLVEENKYIIHLELLSCHSNRMAQFFKKSEEQRQLYATAKMWRKEVKSLISRETAPDTFPLDKAMSLLSKCLKHYPLLEYQVPLRNRLEKSTDDRFKETKNWKGPADANLKRIHFAQVLNRLQLLKVEHVITLVQDLYESLRNIKAKEKKKALTDKVKAAAQMRIILPTYDGVTVGCVVSWIYQQKLHFSDAYQLYQIYQLSDMLGVEALAEICVNKMLSAATESIKLATSQGLGLSALLDQDRDQFPTNENRVDDPLAAIVPMLFTRVLKDGKAPDVLQNLVITSIADSRDLDLFYILKDLFGRSMALDLAEALMKRMCGVTSESRIDVKH